MKHINIIERFAKEGISFCYKNSESPHNIPTIIGKAFGNGKTIRWDGYLYDEKKGYECSYFVSGSVFDGTFETFETIKEAIIYLKGE